MYRVIVITTPDIALGFRLVGVDVEEANTAAEAEAALLKIISGSNYGLVGINEELRNGLTTRTKRLLDETDVPVVISFPGMDVNRWMRQERTDYVASLVRGAIGYHVKLTRD